MALTFLGPRARSAMEVRDRLERTHVPEATTENVLLRLRELGLVDDAELAADLAQRARARGESSSRIRSGLKSRGLSDNAGAEDPENEGDRDRALRLALSRARALKNLPIKVAQRRLAAYLARRGYGFEIVEEVCRETLTDGSPDTKIIEGV